MAVNSVFFSLHCSNATAGHVVGISFSIARFLFFPLFIFIMYLGHQRWRQQRSFATTSHSDIFTYHSASMELIYVVGEMFFFCGEYPGHTHLLTVGYFLCATTIYGQISFHVLTCVERYVAIVHPVTYLRLRHSRGVKIRNISIGCVWLQCFGWIGIMLLYSPDFPYVLAFSILVVALVIVSFCSLSVLHVLIRPGPGETVRDREWVDQSKQRAFNTITSIMGVLWLFFLGFLVCLALENSHVLSDTNSCLVLICGNFVTLPSSLVLPLLFLHREGKLLCCHCNNN